MVIGRLILNLKAFFLRINPLPSHVQYQLYASYVHLASYNV